MRLSELAQLANNTLGIVDTGRNLLTTPQGNGSVSALSQQINNVGAAITSEVRGVRDVLQRDSGTVISMVANAQVQQTALRQEINKVLQGVTASNTLMKKHMNAVEDQLHYIIDEPLQNACYQLTAYLSNEEGIVATDEGLRVWLRILQTWIDKARKQKTIPISLEQAVQSLVQSPDNIYLIALCMQLLFGKMLPEKYLALPPVSIKFYFTAINLYLKGLEKNPHLMGEDKAQSICQEIQNTLNTYLDFSKFLITNKKLWETLLPECHRNEIYMQLILIVESITGSFQDNLKSIAAARREMSLTKPPVNDYQQSADYLYRLTSFKQLSRREQYLPYPDIDSTKFDRLSLEESNGRAAYLKRFEHDKVSQANAPFYEKLHHINYSMYILHVAKGIDAGDEHNFNYEKNSSLHLLSNDEIHEPSRHFCSIEYIGAESISPFLDALRDPHSAKKLKITYQYYQLAREGSSEKETFLIQNKYQINHYYLLILTAILGRYDVFENLTKQYPLPAHFNFSETFKDDLRTPLMIAAQHCCRDAVVALLLKMTPENIKRVSFENKTAAQYAYEQGSEDIAIMIARAGVGVLPGHTLTLAPTSDYKKDLEKMLSDVLVSKTKLGEYVPASLTAQHAASSAQATDSLSDEETSDEMEAQLEKTTSEFFTKHNRHIGRTSFWKRSTQKKYQCMGFRVIDNNEFENDDQRHTFFGNVDTDRIFKISSLKTEKQLLVKLPSMKP